VQVNALQSESALLMGRDGTVVAVALIRNLGSNNILRYGVGLFVPCPSFLYIFPSLYLSIRVLVMFVFFLYRCFLQLVSFFFLTPFLSNFISYSLSLVYFLYRIDFETCVRKYRFDFLLVYYFPSVCLHKWDSVV
jgi:hypothetical protein